MQAPRTDVAGTASLFDASADGDVAKVRLLLALGVPVDGSSSLSIFGGRRAPTALLCAVQHERTEVVAELITHGADVNRRYSNGQSALSYCCASGSHEIAHRILREGRWRPEEFEPAMKSARGANRPEMERALEVARWRRCAELLARQRLALACAMNGRLGGGCLLDRAASGWPGSGELHQMVAVRLPPASVRYGFIDRCTVERCWPVVLRAAAESLPPPAAEPEEAPLEPMAALTSAVVEWDDAAGKEDAAPPSLLDQIHDRRHELVLEAARRGQHSEETEQLLAAVLLAPREELLPLLARALSPAEVEAVSRAQHQHPQLQRQPYTRRRIK